MKFTVVSGILLHTYIENMLERKGTSKIYDFIID